jgi:hypothetical protein
MDAIRAINPSGQLVSLIATATGALRFDLELGDSHDLGATATHSYHACAPAGSLATAAVWTISRANLANTSYQTLPGLVARPATAAAAEALTGWGD